MTLRRVDMEDSTLEKILEELRNSKDPYEQGMARGIEIAMKAYARDKGAADGC